MGGLRVQYQPITLTLAGYAQGRKIARKTRARPRNGRASSRAKPKPRLSLATLVTAANTTVTVDARQNWGSTRRRRGVGRTASAVWPALRHERSDRTCP